MIRPARFLKLSYRVVELIVTEMMDSYC